MHDYEARYRHLKSAGLPGWAGHQYERGLKNLEETLDGLEREGVFARPPARVLELGCGNGMSSFLMARKGYEAYGVDLAKTAVLWARERFASANLGGVFHEGSVCSMPFFDDAFFDIVIDGSCLHCLIGQERRLCLNEVGRILRFDGVFIVSSMCGLPRSDDARARFDHRTSCLMENGRPYRTLKPLKDLELEISSAGFEGQCVKLNVNPWWDHATIACRRSADPHVCPGFSR